MALATYAVPSFLGGQISAFAQGRFDKPDYHISLNVCLNAFPVEIGAWVRRPGTQFAGATRGGGPAGVIKFDFESAVPNTMEFTNGWLRFRQGPTIVTTNDAQTIVAISSANPAIVQTTTAHGWSTGNTVMTSSPSTPLLENRQFTITVVDTTHFSIADALTGTTIVGSTLGSIAAGATIFRILEVTTPYTAQSWQTLRAVQAETTDILLNGSIAPQALIATPPGPSTNATFSLSAASFQDGPYLDPFINGVEVTPNQTTGIVQLTLAFPPYVATTSYAIGDFITSSSVNYESLVDQNIGNTPASSPSDWQAVSAAVAINNGAGFLPTDLGRLVRLFSEPALWLVGSTYAALAVVSYNPSGVPGASTYWQSLVSSNTGNVPGSNLTDWEIVAPGATLPTLPDGSTSLTAGSGPAQWTWGKIVSFANTIRGNPSGGAAIGNMTGGGGNAAAFNGRPNQNAAASASIAYASGSVTSANSIYLQGYVGNKYSGASPASYAIASVNIIPSTDLGLVQITANGGRYYPPFNYSVTAYLFASHSAPSGWNNGTQLGSAVIASGSCNISSTIITLNLGHRTTIINSSNQTTAYAYVWVAIQTFTQLTNNYISATFTISEYVGQAQLTSTTGTGVIGNGINVELLGPPLLYTNAIQTWQLGAYNGITGYPTCGCYDSGRLWLGGAIANRFDASVSNGINGNVINMAPTDQYGNVGAASGITETIDSDSVNPILWMVPDLQGILCGTLSGEFLLSAPTAGGIAANNIAVRRLTTLGSAASVEPRRTDHTLVIVQRYGRKLNEFFADIFSGKMSAPNLADKAQNVTSAGIQEIAFTQATTPIVWGCDGNNALFGVTYKRDSLASSQGPTYAAWHQHALGSGRTVSSLCAGPSVDGELDALTMVTLDTTTNISHVEIMTDVPDENTPLAQCWFLDDAVNPSSTTTSNAAVAGAPYGGLTINGLWHLNGKTVQVFAGGLDCGDNGPGTTGFTDFVVASGSIFVPYGDSISAGSGRGLFTAAFAAALPLTEIVVGFTYTSQGQLVRPVTPAETGARNGPALGKLRRLHYAFMQVVGAVSSSISVGTSFGVLTPLQFKQANPPVEMSRLTPVSGIYRVQPTDGDTLDGMLCWQISRPLPGNIVSVGGALDTKDV